jgi:hypothetical protein
LIQEETHSAKLISLDLIWLSATKTSFINQIRKFLFHQFLNLLDRLLETSLGRARNVEVKGRILDSFNKLQITKRGLTYSSRSHALIRVVISTRGDILKSQHEISLLKRK